MAIRKSTLLLINFCFLIVFIFAIVIWWLEANFNIITSSSVIRVDKYYMSKNIIRYLLALFCLLYSSFIVYLTTAKNKFLLTPTNLFWLLLIVLVFPGVIITAPANEIGLLAATSYSFSLVTFAIGVYFANSVFKFRPQTENTTFLNNIRTKRILTKRNELWVLITVIFSLIYLLGYNLISEIDPYVAVRGIIEFFSSGLVGDFAQGVSAARARQYQVGLSYFDVIRNYIIRIIMPISAVSFIAYSNNKYNNKKKVMGYFLIIVSIISAIGSGSRMFVGHLVLFYVLCFTYYNPINLKKVALFIVSSISLLTLQTVTLGRMRGAEGFFINIIMALNRTFERIFLTKGAVTVSVFEYFPNIEGFRWGTTILPSLLGGFSNRISLAAEMYSYRTGGQVGTAGPQSFGELYANFGVIGMLMGSFALGFIIQTIAVKMIRSKNINPYKVAIYCYVSFLIALMGYSGLMTAKTYGIHILFFYILTGFVVKSVVFKPRILIVKKEGVN